MRILHVNKFLYRRGGAEGYMFDVAALQRRVGHEVEHFAMTHPDNEPSRFSRHFPSQVDFDPAPDSLKGKVRGAARLMWSTSAKAGLEHVLDEFRPDLVHMHNIYHQLSPSILQPLKKRGIPAVLTMHDYKLACPTYQFLAHGQICEACLGGKFHNAARRRCNNGSFSASLLNSVEMTLHSRMNAYGPVDIFSCPSRFLAKKMDEAGVYPDKLRVVNNFVATDETKLKEGPGGGIIFAGRLSFEKGVDVLVRAAAKIDAPLDIAGDGPERPGLEALAKELGATKITFHGRLPMSELHDYVRTASVSVVPSRWYENQPLSILESFACGVPVVGTDLGGIPELIEPGVDGDIVMPNDADALAASLETFVRDPQGAFDMGRAGRAKVDERFSPMYHLDKLNVVYDEAVAAHSPSLSSKT